MRFVEITARSIISRCKMPDADWAIDPYVGCAFGCAYCYATYSGAAVGQPVGAWGQYVYVKANALSLIDVEIHRMMSDGTAGAIMFGTLTDPYQAQNAGTG